MNHCTCGNCSSDCTAFLKWQQINFVQQDQKYYPKPCDTLIISVIWNWFVLRFPHCPLNLKSKLFPLFVLFFIWFPSAEWGGSKWADWAGVWAGLQWDAVSGHGGCHGQHGHHGHTAYAGMLPDAEPQLCKSDWPGLWGGGRRRRETTASVTILPTTYICNYRQDHPEQHR